MTKRQRCAPKSTTRRRSQRAVTLLRLFWVNDAPEPSRLEEMLRPYRVAWALSSQGGIR